MSMELQHGIFTVKLCELEQEYSLLLSRLRLLQEKELDKIRQERKQMQEEYRAHGRMLEETARCCRSRTMARLAEILRSYERQTAVLWEAGGCGGQAEAEAVTLSAEYALDFATQAMRYALITALQALELQIQADKATAETPQGGQTDIYPTM